MSDETNGNGRLDRIEQTLEKLADAQLNSEFTTVKRSRRFQKNLEAMRELQARTQNDIEAMRELSAKTQKHVDHITQLVGIFGDKTYEFDEKVKRVKEAL